MSQQKLSELCYGTLPHSPYSMDLSYTGNHFLKHLGTFLINKYIGSELHWREGLSGMTRRCCLSRADDVTPGQILTKVLFLGSLGQGESEETKRSHGPLS
ncbi:hypothetical protein ANCDUO_10718 [Ancylostoma duodenale]|uniref:Uncharacterized protein n=1 Tax=Ancylostoma duodenale TaxID=51022 RepID=A0A0C2GD61_9BILA|nr:hypothetical protein ANCDUO_10718 [Ancylostoma duodenale]